MKLSVLITSDESSISIPLFSTSPMFWDWELWPLVNESGTLCNRSLVFLLKATIDPETLLSSKLKSSPMSYWACFSQVNIALPKDDGETAPLSLCSFRTID